MTLKNPYNIQMWRKNWLKMPQADKIFQNTRQFCWSYYDMTWLRACLNDTVYERPREVLAKYNITDMHSWYYLNFLDISPDDHVIDIGCGTNPWKEYFPNIIGMDSDAEHEPDLVDTFDYYFCANRPETFDKIIAVNSIHFTNMFDIGMRIQWVWDMLKPGGKAWIGTNIETWLMHTPADEIGKPEQHKLINYFLDQLLAWNEQALVIDINLPHSESLGIGTIRNDLNGNLHLVLHKPV